METAAPTETVQSMLDELAALHRVPGAALGLLVDGEITSYATGVCNVATGVEATPDTLFQYGSIGKVMTTTLVMQLVDEGLVSLEEPVRTYVPGLELADPGAAATITVRQLLTHTSGIDGDHFLDTGRGDDCIERYVASLREVSQISPPGELFSYCNAGFVLAGRLVEILRGACWDDVLRERLVGPLGATMVTLPEDALLHRAAVGHFVKDGEVRPAPAWMLPRSVGPAGLVTGTVAGLLEFVQMHLDGGRDVVSAASATEMRTEQIELPNLFWDRRAWGLGWIRYDWDGRTVIGHDGGTIGQMAFLRVVPDDGFGVALLTNGTGGGNLYRDLMPRLFAERGIAMPQPWTPSEDVSFDPARYEGTYVRELSTTTVSRNGDGLALTVVSTGPTAGLTPPVENVPLRPSDTDRFLVRLPTADADAPVVFLGRAGAPAAYLHLGGRAGRRA